MATQASCPLTILAMHAQVAISPDADFAFILLLSLGAESVVITPYPGAMLLVTTDTKARGWGACSQLPRRLAL